MWLKPYLIPLSIVVAFVVGFGAGARWIGQGYQTQIANINAAHAENRAAIAEVGQARLLAAKKRSDALEFQLNAAESHRLTQALEHQREIKRLTTGRPCLNRGTVGLLNRSTGIQPATLSEAPGGSPAEDAGAATDTDIAEWIDYAIRQYDTCRDRLGALIDYEQGE